MKKVLLFVATAIFALSAVSAKEPGNWERSITKAAAKAKAAKKPLFIVVSGASWDKRSVNFERVFDNKDFVKLAGKYAICVYLKHSKPMTAKEKVEIDKCKSLFGKKLVLPACATTNANLKAVGSGSKMKKDVIGLLKAISEASAEVSGVEMTELPKLEKRYKKEKEKKEKEREKLKKKREKKKKD